MERSSTSNENPGAPKKKGRFSRTAIILIIALPLAGFAILAGVFFLQRKGILSTPPSLDENAPARNGGIDLSAGFSPDPFTVSVPSGGHYDVSKLIDGKDCHGYANREPSFSLNYSGSLEGLHFVFTADGGGAGLIVRAPDDRWFCNRYFVAGTAPLVYIPVSTDGQYDIWVTSGEQDVPGRGTLYITGSSLNTSSLFATETPLPISTPIKVLALDPDLPPNNPPKIHLAGLFDPQPVRYWLPSQPGGDIDLADSLYQPNCSGYVTHAPDYVVYWSGGAPYLSFFFISKDRMDTTLAIQNPYETWYCNDDSKDGIDPMVSTGYAPPGEYKVWIGNKTPNTSLSGVFYIEHGLGEFSPRDFLWRGTNGKIPANSSTSPRLGNTALGAGGDPQTYSMVMTAGGAFDLSGLDLGMDCAGFANLAPDLSFDFKGLVTYLLVTFVASDGSDTTLAVYSPEGYWYCGDDYGDGPVNPVDIITYPFTGKYYVWVGNHQPGVLATGTLTITETENPWP
jgi:hypothetical protein